MHRLSKLRAVARGVVARCVAPTGDRGDVPGWVLITVMTAGLVSALWIVADDQLSSLFSNALDAVSGP